MTDTPEQDLRPPALARLAHELRTPLNAILGYADAMTAQTFGPLPPAYREKAAVIGQAARHMLALVDDTADPGAPDGLWAPRRAPFDPAILAREVETLFALDADSAGVRLSVRASGPAGPAEGDRRALAQILINLVTNALKHTAPGGTIEVTLAREAGGFVVTVADSGGLSAAQGTRQGLRIVRALCALWDGVLDAGPDGAGGFLATARLPSPAATETPC